jgi:hypothetical protein
MNQLFYIKQKKDIPRNVIKRRVFSTGSVLCCIKYIQKEIRKEGKDGETKEFRKYTKNGEKEGEK